MDLKLNRFVVAGAVRVDGPGGSRNGAALADFLDLNRVYFLPVQPTAGPDRWTFLNGDFLHPLKGRVMPGDTFDLPDLFGAPYLTARDAVVVPKSYVRFTSAVLNAGIPLPTQYYYVGFSADPRLAENSLAGATFDATWNVAGSANAITALHFRYDPVNKTYLGFEQHLASKGAYAIFSASPLTRPSKFFNLILAAQPSDRLQLRTFSQLHTFQYAFNQPLEVQHVSYVQVTQALPRSWIQANFQLVNYSLLAPTPLGYYGDPSHAFNPAHPTALQVGISSLDQRIGRSPIFARYGFGFGFNHDGLGLQKFGGTSYTTIWNHYVSGTLFTPSIKLGIREDPRKTYFLNAIFSGERQWFSLPHHVDSLDGTVSLSRVFDRTFAVYGSYELQTVGDYYNAGQQAQYPSIVPVIGGISYPSYASFTGVATFRTASLGLTYTPNPSFAFSLLARKHTDFPQPQPGLFALPPTNVLGQSLVTTYLGQPPYDIAGDVRVRLTHNLVVDVQRSYFFNFGNMRWSPQFVVQFTE
jgi:hypothetical protein